MSDGVTILHHCRKDAPFALLPLQPRPIVRGALTARRSED